MVRNAILQTLNTLGVIGGPATFDMVLAGVEELQVPDRQSVVRDLQNLYEKGYVQWHAPAGSSPQKFVPWMERLYSITAKGQDLVDRIERDPTLEL
jgi:hypothetical protein